MNSVLSSTEIEDTSPSTVESTQSSRQYSFGHTHLLWGISCRHCLSKIRSQYTPSFFHFCWAATSIMSSIISSSLKSAVTGYNNPYPTILKSGLGSNDTGSLNNMHLYSIISVSSFEIFMSFQTFILHNDTEMKALLSY